jgi:fatty acid desaturase
MKIWKNSPLDAMHLAFIAVQFVAMLWMAHGWERFSLLSQVGSVALLVTMMWYNIVVVGHLFTHVPWFDAAWANDMVSMFNSINIGHSMQSYRLKHVRNHHVFHNDLEGRDISSSYVGSVDGGYVHVSAFRYAFEGAYLDMVSVIKTHLLFIRLWSVGTNETLLRELAVGTEPRRSHELRQIQRDRIANFLGLVLLSLVSWKWTLACYVPALFIAVMLMSFQNYFEHYGATPGDRFANAVSYYGRLYNLLAFNDGYHQEHHLRPQAHWSTLPAVRVRYGTALDEAARVISPVPAVAGILHRGRPLRHRGTVASGTVAAIDP